MWFDHPLIQYNPLFRVKLEEETSIYFIKNDSAYKHLYTA
jgi:hypothetical protein